MVTLTFFWYGGYSSPLSICKGGDQIISLIDFALNTQVCSGAYSRQYALRYHIKFYYQGRIQGGGAWDAQAPPSSYDSI